MKLDRDGSVLDGTFQVGASGGVMVLCRDVSGTLDLDPLTQSSHEQRDNTLI